MNAPAWIDFKLSDEEVFSHRTGPLTFFLKKIMNEVWVATTRDTNHLGEPASLSDNPEWSRVALPKTYHNFRVTPILPDRPVVVDTEHTYKILTGADSRVYCQIPVFVRITPESRPDFIITEIPSVVLSDTWFGEFTEGELSYSLSSTARRTLQSDMFDPHLIVCPMEIRNKSDQDLHFEKMCLRVDRLSVYTNGHELWADETLITHHGKDGQSDMEMKGKVPAEAPNAFLLTKPRTPIKKSMAIRTFHLFRD